jgi:hypothetical protein
MGDVLRSVSRELAIFSIKYSYKGNPYKSRLRINWIIIYSFRLDSLCDFRI